VELLLVRHALPARIELTEGRADPGLTSEGHAQASLLSEYLRSERIDAIYSSPLQRAQETAGPTANRLGLDIVTVDGVAEFDRDSSEYVPVEELRASGDPRFHEVTTGVWSDAAVIAPFERLVTASVEQLIDRHPGERIMIVCHAGVINLYLSVVLGLAADQRGFFYPNYTSINRVMAGRGGQRSILTINETAHLRNSGLPMGLHQKG
jgi:2,3-bisphosphoglycerate-dependent phosphoglycerate mutase